METTNLENELAGFIGTTQYYRHNIGGLTYTDGVKYLAEKAKAYWLIDAIASYLRREHFQVWTLTVSDNNRAVLTMKQDCGQPIIVRQEIDHTDFPLKEFELWLVSGVLMLKSEY